MAEYIKFDGNVLWHGNGSTPEAVFEAEEDINGRVHVIEDLGDRYANLYRDTKAENRAYTATFTLKATPTVSLQVLKAQWEQMHRARGGLRTLERQTDTGRILQLSVVPETPQWSEEHTSWQQVVQAYTSPDPFWQSAAEQSASAAYDGETPVALTCVNDGDEPCWVRFDLADAIEDPKIELADEWELEFGLTMGAGDALAIVCKTPATAWYTESGEDPTRAYGYRTAATLFRKTKLAVGSNALSLSATSGTGTCVAYWRELFDALR